MVAVSVIVPAYNAAATIERAIESALGQTVTDLEIIVVDDCSTDDTVDRVLGMQSRDSRLRLVRLPANGGPSIARNAAIDAAAGEWIALLDADDLWRPDRLEVLLSQTGFDLVADQIIGFDADAGIETGFYMRRVETGEVDLARLLRTGFGYDYGFLKPIMRRSFLDAACIRYPVDMRYGEDFLFYVRCLTLRGRFWLVPYAGYVYTTPRGRQSGAVSVHSHTRPDKLAIAAAVDRIAVEHDAGLTEAERVAFAYCSEFYRSRVLFDAFLSAFRGGDVKGSVAAFASAPASVSQHLGRELWVRSLARLRAG